jgi:hypothetical protein
METRFFLFRPRFPIETEVLTAVLVINMRHSLNIPEGLNVSSFLPFSLRREKTGYCILAVCSNGAVEASLAAREAEVTFVISVANIAGQWV